MTSVPTVSILMGVYNEERFLSASLDSLLTQSLSDFELVIVDDGSTDGTAEVLERYAGWDDRVLVLRNDENRGLAASLNRGLARCRASLIARADADDVYKPERLERQVAFMQSHPKVGVLSSSVDVIDGNGEKIDERRPPLDDEKIRQLMPFVNCMAHPGVVFVKDLVEEVGGYDERFRTSQDSDLWARLRHQTKFANLREPLVLYRRHDDAVTRGRGEEERLLSASVNRRILSEYIGVDVENDYLRAFTVLLKTRKRIEPNLIELATEMSDRIKRQLYRDRRVYAATYVDDRMGERLLAQSAYHLEDNRSASILFFYEAVKRKPRVARSKAAMKYVAGLASSFLRTVFLTG